MNATATATTTQQITFTPKMGISLDQDESSTLWVGRLPKGCTDPAKRRDVALSQPLPVITAEQVQELAITHAPALAALVSEGFADYLRRVKTARLTLGSSYAINLPTDPQELASMMLTVLTEGSRERRELSAATIRDVINSSEFKAAAAARCQQTGISADAFKRIVVDGYLRGCTREDFGIYAGQEGTRDKAAAHLRAVHLAAPSRALELAIARIEAAQTIEEGI